MNSHPSSREMTLRSFIILLAPYWAPARSGRLRKHARARRASASALPRARVLDDATRSVLRARAGYERVGDVRSVARGVARARARRSARPRRHGRPRGRATRVAYVYARDEKTVRRASGRGTVSIGPIDLGTYGESRPIPAFVESVDAARFTGRRVEHLLSTDSF
jgi:hypothetical protein